MLPPITLTSFGMHVVDGLEKRGLNLGDVLFRPEVVGALSGGVLGGLVGDVISKEEENRWRNRVLGALLGAALGGGGAHLLAGGSKPQGGSATSAPSPPSPPSPAPRTDIRPSVLPTGPRPSGEAVIPAANIEPALAGSEQAVRGRIAQQANQQAVQLSAARERAAILRDQGRVAARLQQLLTPGKRPLITPRAQLKQPVLVADGRLRFAVPATLTRLDGHVRYFLAARRYPAGTFATGPAK